MRGIGTTFPSGQPATEGHGLHQLCDSLLSLDQSVLPSGASPQLDRPSGPDPKGVFRVRQAANDRNEPGVAGDISKERSA